MATPLTVVNITLHLSPCSSLMAFNSSLVILCWGQEHFWNPTDLSSKFFHFIVLEPIDQLFHSSDILFIGSMCQQDSWGLVRRVLDKFFIHHSIVVVAVLPWMFEQPHFMTTGIVVV